MLTSADDIVYPTGWSLSVSTDGTSFTSTLPTSTAGWAAVRAVKTTGTVVSQGSSNGNQIATGSSTQPMLPPAGGFDATSPGQDPWTMAFDDDGRIFTQVHHKYGFNGSPAIQCRARTGSWCANGPFDRSRTELWNEALGIWVTSLENERGRWTVVGEYVEFVPKAGFTGIATIRLRVPDATGEMASANLMVTVGPGELPRTGAGAPVLLLWALVAIVFGLRLSRSTLSLGRTNR